MRARLKRMTGWALALLSTAALFELYRLVHLEYQHRAFRKK